MSDRSKIEWTDTTWNPVQGCSRVSPGCENCYAERMARRFDKPGMWGEGLTVVRNGKPGWSGDVRLREEIVEDPLRWRKPRRVFVCSTSDLFHEKVPFPYIARVFWTMMRAPKHTFQVLTKRPRRAVEFFRWLNESPAEELAPHVNERAMSPYFPPEHVHIGVSAEDQKRLMERVPYLMHIPASVRWLSAEPLLGPLDLGWLDYPDGRIHPLQGLWHEDGTGTVRRRCLDWIVVGGESGQGARPMHPDWVRDIRDACEEHDVPFFFKQWGEFGPVPDGEADFWLSEAGERYHYDCGAPMRRLGKHRSGRELDGRTWDEQPLTLIERSIV